MVNTKKILVFFLILIMSMSILYCVHNVQIKREEISINFDYAFNGEKTNSGDIEYLVGDNKIKVDYVSIYIKRNYKEISQENSLVLISFSVSDNFIIEEWEDIIFSIYLNFKNNNGTYIYATDVNEIIVNNLSFKETQVIHRVNPNETPNTNLRLSFKQNINKPGRYLLYLYLNPSENHYTPLSKYKDLGIMVQSGFQEKLSVIWNEEEYGYKSHYYADYKYPNIIEYSSERYPFCRIFLYNQNLNFELIVLIISLSIAISSSLTSIIFSRKENIKKVSEI